MLQTVTQNHINSHVVDQSLKAMEDENLTLNTRFGEIEVSTDKPLIFQQGLLGIAGNPHYALTDFPSEKLARFKLLQSLSDEKVSFITLPIKLDNLLIDKADLIKAATDIGIADAADLAVMLIVSVHRSPTEIKLSANSRAPILVHVPTRQAVQYVFQNNKYEVREMLNFSE